MVDNQKILYKFIQTNKNIDWSNISYTQKLLIKFKEKFNILLYK